MYFEHFCLSHTWNKKVELSSLIDQLDLIHQSEDEPLNQAKLRSMQISKVFSFILFKIFFILKSVYNFPYIFLKSFWIFWVLSLLLSASSFCLYLFFKFNYNWFCFGFHIAPLLEDHSLFSFISVTIWMPTKMFWNNSIKKNNLYVLQVVWLWFYPLSKMALLKQEESFYLFIYNFYI